ncbi:MAG: hypothetical protein HYS05_22350 [Acidobacteria bacterium]|nr:hypothetical protein [Acidobacteriota bacterium]
MILPLDSEVSLEAGGGKGANLARLVRAGFCVPPGFIVTTQAYCDYVSGNQMEDWILETARVALIEDSTAIDTTSAAIRARFASATLRPEVADAIRAAYGALDRLPVAVRSSATTEDLPDLSFAGQQDTMLNVIGDAALLRAVVQCWSSLWTARAIAYRARNGIAHENAALAVIVQQMVASDVSGVLFTANPLTGKRSETVIEATFGLGEALVSGRVEPDRYVVDVPAGRVLERRRGAKALSIRARAEGGTFEAPEDAAGRATLTESAALALAGLGQRVATLFDAPQDIEWAQAGERFHLLQARPITSLFPLPDGLPADELRVLISVGAFQGMLDPITPVGLGAFSVALPRAAAWVGGPLAHGRARPFKVAGNRIFLDLTPMVRRPRIRALVRSALRAIEPATGDALDQTLAEFTPAPVELRPWLRASSLRLIVLLSRALGNMTYKPDLRARAATSPRPACVAD